MNAYEPTAPLPCSAPDCNQPRLRITQRRVSQFCATHHAEDLAYQQQIAAERAIRTCTLDHLWERWTTHPYAADSFVDGKQVYGMRRAASGQMFSVVLKGANEPVWLHGATVVTLGSPPRLGSVEI